MQTTSPFWPGLPPKSKRCALGIAALKYADSLAPRELAPVKPPLCACVRRDDARPVDAAARGLDVPRDGQPCGEDLDGALEVDVGDFARTDLGIGSYVERPLACRRHGCRRFLEKCREFLQTYAGKSI